MPTILGNFPDILPRSTKDDAEDHWLNNKQACIWFLENAKELKKLATPRVIQYTDPDTKEVTTFEIYHNKLVLEDGETRTHWAVSSLETILSMRPGNWKEITD